MSSSDGELRSALVPEREEFLERDDGASLCLQKWGDASAPPLLILDGIGCAGWAFRRIVPRLRERYHVVLMHYRGHGRSPTPPRPWRLGMHDFADDAAATLRHVADQPALVVGFSMGFQVALELYKRHREQVAGLVSLAGPSGRVMAQFQGTEAFGHVVPLLLAASRHASDITWRIWKSVVPSNLVKRLGLTTQLNAERIEIADFDFYLKQIARMSPELFTEVLQEASRHCTDDLLSRVRARTLIMAGGKDKFVPLATMRSMAFAIPGANWVMIPEASHALPAEFPDEISKRVLEFGAEL